MRWLPSVHREDSSDPSLSEQAATARRGFLAKGLLAFVGGLLARRAQAAEPEPKASSLAGGGEVVKTNMAKGRPPVEPLDTMMRFERSDNSRGPAITHEILSLIHEETGTKSFPWTMYAHLSTQHVEGDACVVCSRLHKKGPGWSCGLHSEIFSDAPGVGLGMNVEVSNTYTGPAETQIIGLNVQAHGTRPCQMGIQVHDWDSHFDKAIGLNGKGRVGLDLGGKFDVGIHAHGNSIRLDEGAGIELDGAGKIRVRYNDGRIEFMNGSRCIGHIKADGEDHAL